MPELLAPKLLKQLEQFRINSTKRTRSSVLGERRSRSRGQSVEYADHRRYSPGDDLRYLDWNVFGRLDRLFLKLYEEERELSVRIFLDASQSMAFGEPTKFEFARKIAAAIGYVALCGFDRVSVIPFPERFRGLKETAGPPAASEVPVISETEFAARRALVNLRGKKSALSLLQNLSAVSAGGAASLSAVLKHEASKKGAGAVAVVLSDFLDPLGYADGLNGLISRGFHVIPVQILAPDELEPGIRGDLRLVDAETGAFQEVTFGRYRLKAYRQAVQDYLQQLESFCSSRGLTLFRVTSDGDLQDLLLKKFREATVWG